MSRLHYSLLMLPGLMIGLTVHEFAHAWSASLLGDNFSRRQGRVSLNPFHQLSLLGTLAIFLLPMGWGKPVLINLYNFRRPKRDYLLTSLAGPAANLLVIALCFGVMQLTRWSYLFGESGVAAMEFAHLLLMWFALINGMLATVNLLPIPPFDGSKIWPCLIPGLKPTAGAKWSKLFIVLLLVLVWTGALAPVFHTALGAIIHIAPESDRSRFQRNADAGDAAYDSRLYQVAEFHYTEALNIAEESFSVYFGRAHARLCATDYLGAVRDVERALELAENQPEFPELRNALLSLQLRAEGLLAESKQELFDAEALFTRALTLDPNQDALLFDRGNVRAEQGNRSGALEDLDRAIELNDTNPDYFDYRAYLLKWLGKADQAQADLARARALRWSVIGQLPDPNEVPKADGF